MEMDDKVSKVQSKSLKLLKEVIGWIEAIIIAFVLAVLIREYLFVTTEVYMPSMQDTLFDGQRLIVYKLGYYFHPPRRGDIIIFEFQEGIYKGLMKLIPFKDPKEVDYVKRVIGLPGEVVDIKNNHVYINGKQLYEPYVKGITEQRILKFPATVPQNKIFVLGDNREVSSDSREIGFIDLKKVKGKAIFRIWPLKDFGGIYETKDRSKTGTQDGN